MRRTLDPSRAPRLREVLEPGSFFFLFFVPPLLLFSRSGLFSALTWSGSASGDRASVSLGSRHVRRGFTRRSDERASTGGSRACCRCQASRGTRRRCHGDLQGSGGGGVSPPGHALRLPRSGPLRPRYQRAPTRTHSLSHFVSPSPFFLTLSITSSLPLPFFSLSLPHSLSLSASDPSRASARDTRTPALVPE